MKKLIPALAMLVVSALLMSSASYAWFTMNKTVTVSGMSVTAKVSSNLLISSDTLGSTTKNGEGTFGNNISTSFTGQLEPVSTTTGKAFFYTTNSQADGNAIADVYTAYNVAEIPTDTEKTEFNTKYGTTGAVGYIDYVFQLKAINSESSAKAIKITKLDLTYAGGVDANKAYRVAAFVENLGETGATASAGTSGTLLGIYSQTGAANFSDNGDNNFAVSAVSTAPTQLSANYNTVTNIASVPAAKTNYYKVVIRLYLEGEDTTCNNATFLPLTAAWALDIELSLDTATENTAVTAIKKYTSASVTLKTVTNTKLYYDGTDIYLANKTTKLNTASTKAIPTASIGSNEIDDINAAFGLSGDAVFTVS